MDNVIKNFNIVLTGDNVENIKVRIEDNKNTNKPSVKICGACVTTGWSGTAIIAKEFAREMHGEQLYGNAEYIRHLEYVAGAFNDPRLQTIAYLHDVIDDTPATYELLTTLFGEKITDKVRILTRVADEEYFSYINRISKDTDATRVKIWDLKCHLDENFIGLPSADNIAKFNEALIILQKGIKNY